MIPQMKKLIMWGAFALLTTTMISCTADENEDVKTTKPAVPAYADGPGDQTIPVPPPKKPD